ncbi:MAG: glycosyltransferase family 4 protein [Candidatus Thalassarchaeaceae archaeon]
MHIAMLSAEFPPRWGGMGSTVFHLSAALVKRGHKVTVITRSGAGESPSQESVRVLEVGWAKIPMEFTRSFGRRAILELERLNDRDPVDIVHLHCPMISWSQSQFKRCSEKVAPVVTSLHGSWLGERDGLIEASNARESAVWANVNDVAIRFTAGWYSRFENFAINESSICVANSNATREDFELRYDAPKSWNCRVVHWGVDIQMFRPIDHSDPEDMDNHLAIRARFEGGDPESKIILAVGRLAARKGYGSLIKGFSKLQKKIPTSRLVIVGRGHLKSRLLKQAKRLGVGDFVHIESGMSFPELAQLYRSANLVVYPSFYEGQGLIPLEAMSSGVPIVTVDHGPLPEMVDESVGALFKMGNTESMIGALERTLNEEGYQKGVQGRKRVVEKFNFDGNAEVFEKIYLEAIQLQN